MNLVRSVGLYRSWPAYVGPCIDASFILLLGLGHEHLLGPKQL